MAVLCLLLLAVCIVDYMSTRIPNGMILLTAAVGVCCCYRDNGAAGAGVYFIVCLLVLFILYPLFMIGAIGAGDVKLYAVTAGFFSGRAIFSFLITSLLIAAIFSLIKILKERNGRERLYYFCSYLAEVFRVRKWHLYIQSTDRDRRSGICLSGPVFLSVLLHLGGVC